MSAVLEPHLAQFSYIGGHVPSRLDWRVHARLAEAPPPERAHVARWWRHVRCLSAEAGGWPAGDEVVLARLGLDRLLAQVGPRRRRLRADIPLVGRSSVTLPAWLHCRSLKCI